MIINIVYFLITLIFLFIILLIFQAVKRGIKAKNDINNTNVSKKNKH